MKARARKMTITIWALSALLATIYIHTGTKKVFPDLRGSQDTTVAHFRAWGYSDDFRVFIGCAEIAGAGGLLVPPVATIAAVALVPIMVGATYNHIVHGDSSGKTMVPIIVMGLLFFVAYQRRTALVNFSPMAAAQTG